MFERDLPGENKSGLSFQQASQQLPLETCETMNDSWGFNLTDRNYKSAAKLIQYLVNAAGRNANFLLNIGPMPDGRVQSEFTDTLLAMGSWLKQYGRSVYGTRGSILPPQEWGVLTAKDKSVYVHILKPPAGADLFIPGLKPKLTGAVIMNTTKPIRFKQQPEGVFIYTDGIAWDNTDTIIELKTE